MDSTDNKAPARSPELFTEIATVKRDITYPAFIGLLLNQDDTLIQRGAGKGLKIYDDIERDAHAYSVLQKRKLAVIARPWSVEPASEDPEDKRAAEVVKAQLDAINFDQVTLDLLDAVLKGFSIGEVMWEAQDALLVASRMIARNQRRFVFNDEYRLHMLTLEDLVYGELMPERKFIVHCFGAKDGSPYGLGLGSKLYWPVFFKRNGASFWAMFNDKFGMPTALGKYPTGTTDPEKKVLLDALAAIAQDTGIAIPEGMAVDLLEAKRSGSFDTYEKFLRYWDEQISEAVLGETMTTSARGAGLGSSQAEVHNEVRLELVRADADLLSGTLNRTLVRWISEYNVPGAKPPRVWRKVEEAKDTSALAERDKNVASMGFKPSLQYIQDTYGDGWSEAPKPTPPAPGAAPIAGLLTRGMDPAAFAEPAAATGFPGQAAVDRAAGDASIAAAMDARMEKLLTPVLELVKSGARYEDVIAKLASIFPKMDEAGLEELLARAIFVGDLWGEVNAANDTA